jgi:hypothetical protein
MIADGVDGIVTNYPTRLTEVLSGLRIQEPEVRSQKSGVRSEETEGGV